MVLNIYNGSLVEHYINVRFQSTPASDFMFDFTSLGNASVAEAGEFYFSRMKWQPLKLIAKDKKPIEQEWTTKNNFSTSEEVKDYFKGHRGNIGIRLGECSNNIVVLDFDTEEARKAFLEEMPELNSTLQSCGKKVFGHCWIQVDTAFKKHPIIRWHGKEKQTLCDVLCDGAQVLVAPSIHPEKNEDGAEIKYQWLNNLPIIAVSNDRLMLAIKNVCRKLGVDNPFGDDIGITSSDIMAATPASNDIFKRVKERVQISDVTGTKDARMNCLVHKETSPNQAMEQYLETNTVHCFSCEFSGDVIALRAEMKGISQYEAALELAKEYGVEITPAPFFAGLGTDEPIVFGGPRPGDKQYLIVQDSHKTLTNGNINVDHQYEFYHDRIDMRQFYYTKNGVTNKLTNVVIGDLKILNRLIFTLGTNRVTKWLMQFNGQELAGSLDEIVSELISYGVANCNKDELRKIISILISRSNPVTLQARPCVGLFYDHEKKLLAPAIDSSTVLGESPTQEEFKSKFITIRNLQKSKPTKPVEVVQATADFINSMPKCNKLPALLARAFGCIAPFAYELKKTSLAVFPYMYLYGSTNSSKTSIALSATSYVWGELEPLNNSSIGSDFRISAEFTATTFPRTIDEADQVFQKNAAVFKSSATSTLSNKRGTKEKHMDIYSAFASFIFTSNNQPITSEADTHGGIMSRLLMLECQAGDDFNEEQYQKALNVLMDSSVLFGDEIIQELRIQVDGGIAAYVNQVQQTGAIIRGLATSSHGGLDSRRAYCLAELVMGVELYYSILKRHGIPQPIPFENRQQICEVVYQAIQSSAVHKEKEFILEFMDWVKERIKSSEEQDKFRINIGLDGIVNAGGNEFIIKSAALKAYKKQYSLNQMSARSLEDLVLEFQKIGLREAKLSNTMVSNWQHWGIKIDLDKYNKHISKLFERQGTLEP